MRKIITIIAVIMMTFAGFTENWKANYRVNSISGAERYDLITSNPHWTELKDGFWIYPNPDNADGAYIDPYFNNEIVGPIFRKAIDEAKLINKNICDLRYVYIIIHKDETSRTFIYDVDEYILWEYK